ncbi:MAG TPA: DUF2795 domain-containing protein [Nitrososphaeraceae archaeon]|nr:DUF2795 domain-containing protein [Nitrososphaeraceae archaeon]
MVKEDKKQKKSNIGIIEQGDIFFFYRPKVDTEEVKDIKDVQRFYMVTTPEKQKKNDIYRLFLIGQKQLPEIIEGKSTSEEKNWALNILTTSNPDDVHKELLPAEYTTETKGKRRLAAAAPAGEGKYKIVKHDNHTELAYLLELPEIPGPTQREFEIKKEASYIISVKNPEVNITGFATVSEKKPEYPKHIKEKFGDKRWISIENPQLLNYENTQVLLIGARKKDVEEELDIDIDEQKETENTADIFKELKVRKEQVPLKPLMKGTFPDKEEIPMALEVKQLSKEEYPGGKGGKVGGKVAATASTSAAGIAKMLSGIEFPKDKNELVDYAKENKSEVKRSDQIIKIIKELPDRKYHNMVDIEKALGEIR